MSHLPKLKSDGGKLTYAGFILYKENLLSLGENRRLKKKQVHIRTYTYFKKKHSTLGPFQIKGSLFTASSHVCIDVFLNLSTCMDRSM